MWAPPRRPSRVMGALLLAGAAVANAVLFNPVVQAQQKRTCSLAANP